MKMHVLSCGKMTIDRASLVSGESEAVQTAIPVPVLLFDHPDGYILYDTACDPEGMTKNWPEHNKAVSPHELLPGESLPERLRALGVGPGEIARVVVSHLHTDHAGCLPLPERTNPRGGYGAERDAEALRPARLAPGVYRVRHPPLAGRAPCLEPRPRRRL